MQVIYFHGFGSSGKSQKVDQLRAVIGKDNVFSPDLPFDPQQVEGLVAGIVKNTTAYPIVFVGTSLGGFYANYFANKYDCPCVLINPSTRPSNSMRERMATPQHSYATGEEIVITEQHLAKFKAMEEYLKDAQNGSLINLFLAEDDEVIPYEQTEEDIPYSALKTIKPQGGHRFSEHWGAVCDFIAGRWTE